MLSPIWWKLLFLHDYFCFLLVLQTFNRPLLPLVRVGRNPGDWPDFFEVMRSFYGRFKPFDPLSLILDGYKGTLFYILKKQGLFSDISRHNIRLACDVLGKGGGDNREVSPQSPQWPWSLLGVGFRSLYGYLQQEKNIRTLVFIRVEWFKK